jgi:hypothetical protein
VSGSLTPVRRKLFWAEHHMTLLGKEMRAFYEHHSEPSILSEFDPADQCHVLTFSGTTDIPTRWGLIVGDYVSSARSSLDHLVWQLVLANGGVPGRNNSFPVLETQAGWLRNVEQRAESRGPGPLEGISTTAWSIIKELQPYNAGDRDAAHATWLAALHYLWNVDKHQVIHGAMAYATGDAPEVTVEPSDCLQVSKVFYGRRRLEDGAEIARVQVVEIKPPPGGNANVHFDIPISVAFGEEGKGVASVGFLAHMLRKLHEVVSRFEPEF